MRILRFLAIAVTTAFVLLLIVGFDNLLAVFRSRVALAIAIAPIFFLFIWCIYKAFQPRRLQDTPEREKRD